MILSASRRTDIPAYYADWFWNRIEAGSVLVRNPVNPRQISRISLDPALVDCIVFWSKDPALLLATLPALAERGYPYLFQFTLTPYGPSLEKNLRPKREILHTFRCLSRMIGPERVHWRYDPVLLNDTCTPDWHKAAFASLCRALSGYTCACTISFLDGYGKLRPMLQRGLFREVLPAEMIELAASFSHTAAQYGISLSACCEPLDLRPYGVEAGACISQKAVEAVCRYPVIPQRDPSQRSGCGCIKSIDIGAYNTCKSGCLYCYACRPGHTAEPHDPRSPLLAGRPAPNETVHDRQVESLRQDQLGLF